MDSQEVYQSINNFPNQCQTAWESMSSVYIPSSYALAKNIVIAGMGGSALGGRIIQSLEKEHLRIPINVVSEFFLPQYCDKSTHAVICSYSGNTKETLSMLDDAINKKCQIFLIASDGKLKELIDQKKFPGFVIDSKDNPSNQPRLSVMSTVVCLLSLFSRLGLINPIQDTQSLFNFLKKKQIYKNVYSQIAHTMQNKTVILVTAEHLRGTGVSIRNIINENAKHLAFNLEIPDLTHHLLEGLSFPKSIGQNIFFLLLNSHKYHTQIQTHFETFNKFLEKRQISKHEIYVDGPNRLFEVFESLQLGTYISFYLSKANDIDPGPVPWVNWYKDEIRKVV